ncbi:MAG TPA: MarR family transcriptional regulator, partial [Planctomycetota bacterium]|nr:MarR family transcriptional regulator [Planctomycetota bacterium]
RREDTASGLSGPRLSALSVLVFGGPRSLGDLAAAEQVRPPTMTRLVAALERQKLVAREGHPDDARVVLLSATAKGRALLESGRDRRVRALGGALDKLPAAELARLGKAVESVRAVVTHLEASDRGRSRAKAARGDRGSGKRSS